LLVGRRSREFYGRDSDKQSTLGPRWRDSSLKVSL
jgi:hypothetical protein